MATLATNVGRPRFFISVTIIDEILHNLGAILAYSTILIKGDNEIRIKTCVLPYHGFTLFFVYSGQDLQNPMTDFDETLHTYSSLPNNRDQTHSIHRQIFRSSRAY